MTSQHILPDVSSLSTGEIENLMEELTGVLQSRQFVQVSRNFNKGYFEQRFQELLRDTPTKFPTKNGMIVLRKELVKNILVTIKHLTQELDVFMLFVGREGSGKSKFVRQVNYVYWYLMRDLGLIDYEFSLDLVHFGVRDLQEDRKAWDDQGLYFRISILDESKDDLGRDKHMTPDAKNFIDYMRRCRDECGIISLLLPQLSELMPRITLSRSVFIFEVDYDLDKMTGDIVRGEYNCYIIPRGKTGFSYYHNKEVSTSIIKSELADYLYTNKRQFESLPKKCLFFQGNFNNVDPIDTHQYQLKKRKKKWERMQQKELEMRELARLRNMAEDMRALMLSLKSDGESNYRIADRIGKSEASIRNYWKYFENASAKSEP